MCGGPGTDKRIPSTAEVEYLDALVRGVYAKRDLPAGHLLTDDDVYLAVPLLKGQLSCRELIAGEAIVQPITADQPLTLDFLDNPYSRNVELRDHIQNRGL
jgi:N-acetylneuraminate synthase